MSRAKGEDRCGGANLGSHIGYSGHASTAQGINAGAEILDDKASAAANGQLAGEIQDNVLGRRPAAQLTSKLNAQDVRCLKLPWGADKGLDSISTAHANGDSRQAAGVGGVTIGSEHHQARGGVVLQYALVDNAGTRGPEFDAVLAGGRF